ncbi:MAG: DUF4430 domain-containing protein [Oscillospiraceae bacterium]|nr:DUF4430 domain-containing protein [Oscillospiraceae bacterium]
MKQLSKRILTCALALLICLGPGPVTALASGAESIAGYVSVCVDANVLGAGVLYGPALVPFYEGETHARVTERFLGERLEVETAYGFYLTGIQLPRDFEPVVPAVLSAHTGTLDAGHSQAGEFLRGADFTATAGWFYTVNHEDMGVGVDTVPAEDGDVLRWQFSLIGWGADLGLAWDGDNVFTPNDKTGLIEALAKINAREDMDALLENAAMKLAYDAAYDALADLAAPENGMVSAQAELILALTALENESLLEKWHAKLPESFIWIAWFWDWIEYVILFVFFGWIWFLF